MISKHDLRILHFAFEELYTANVSFMRGYVLGTIETLRTRWYTKHDRKTAYTLSEELLRLIK